MTKSSSVQVKPSQGMGRPMGGMMQRQHTLGQHISVQREAAGASIDAAAPSLVRDVISSPGRPLDASTRAAMEPRFGHDFSNVRVHADDRAAESARAVNANAYTAGNHVAFGRGQFAPGTMSGSNLMAHELTHVVQQSTGTVDGSPIGGGLHVSNPSDRFEQSAAATGASASTRTSTKSPPARTTNPAATTHIQRDTRDLGLTSGGTSSNQAAAVNAWSAAGSALFAGVGLIAAFQSAGAAKRQAVAAERQTEAAEDPPVAEPTTGGIAVTDADIPEIKGLNKEKVEETEVDTEEAEGQDIADTTETPATKKEKKKTHTVSTHAKRTTHKKTITPPDDTESLETYKVLGITQGKGNSATFPVSIRSVGNDIKDGGTEPPEVEGYLGGTLESNASVTFKAKPGKHLDDGSATVKLLIGGTNAPARKTSASAESFKESKPKVNSDYRVQHFGAVVTFSTRDKDGKAKQPPIVDNLKGGAEVGKTPSEPLVIVNPLGAPTPADGKPSTKEGADLSPTNLKLLRAASAGGTL
jgi:hypothetical protein